MYGRVPFRQRLGPSSARPMSGSCIRYAIALAMAAFALISFFGSKVYNPVTKQNQYVGITQEQEIALGLQSAPEMEQQYGGLSTDQQAQTLVDQVGTKLVQGSFASTSGYPFEFSVLADPQTVNAFALPGGPVFITEGLLTQLDSEGELAGVLGHEIVHVVARHAAQQIAQQQLSQGLSGAVVLATYDPNDPRTQHTAQVALLIAQLVNLKYSRSDETEADRLGVCVMSQAGYNPQDMVQVMELLASLSNGQQPPEFLSDHPSPQNRIGNIQDAINNLSQCP